jgi:DNA-binding winged helix-turn-helix (wHTH) protein/TolB-like protein/tetratricopeptide (TPR) repeat protein
LSAATAEICQFHGYRLDMVRRQLVDPDGVPVQLMPKAIETLVHLVLNAGQTVTKDQLLRTVWPDTVVEENNLTQNISALRRAFGEKLGEHRFIVTIPGRGYRFVAPVTPVNRAAQTEPVPADSPLRRWAAIGTVAVVVIVVAVAAVAVVRRMSVGEVQAPPFPQTIAILPFKPVVEGQRNEAMELGMADSLIMELSRSPHLIVRPFNSTRRFAAVDQDPLAAGRQLAVEAVVDGTVQIADDRVRASARLLRTADGRQLWAGKFDEQFSNIFEVQDAIAQRVAGALQIRLNPGAPYQTGNVRAYELYMLGRMHTARLVMPEVRRGIEYFEQAIAEDDSYALAYAGIADAMRSLVLSNDAAPAEMAPRAKETASRAIELAPDLAEVNYARGLVALWFDWDWPAAEKYLSRAVVLAPNNAEAHIYLAHLYSNLGRKPEALKHARRASELNPVSVLIGALEGMFLSHQREHEAAVRRSREAVTLDPTFWLSHHLLANSLVDAGQYEAALLESAEAKRLSPLQTLSDTFRAIALARLRRADEARAILQSLRVAARDTYVPPSHFAMIEAALGNRDKAFEHLDTALSIRDARLTVLKVDPKWDGLRSDPRFQAVLGRMGY